MHRRGNIINPLAYGWGLIGIWCGPIRMPYGRGLKKCALDVALVRVSPFPPTHPSPSSDTGTIAYPMRRENYSKIKDREKAIVSELADRSSFQLWLH